MRVGLSGLGKHGFRYLRHIVNDIEGMEVPYVSRRSENRAREILSRAGIKAGIVRDHRDLFRKDLDAVIIATPTGTHERIAVDAMNSGLHVLVEKPMASTTEECMKMIDASRENNVRLMVAHTLRYNPTIMKLRKMVMDTRIEEISMEQHLEPPDRDWLYDREMAGGGVLLNTGVHIFDTVRFVTGENIIPRTCRTEKIVNRKLEDLAFGSFDLSGGGSGSFCTSRYHTTRRREIDINNGEFFADAMREIILKPRLTDVGGERRTLIPLLKNFRDSVENNNPITITGEDGLKAVKTCQGFHRAVN